MRQHRTVLKVVGASLVGSTLFFLLSNLGVWMIGHGDWYPRTFSGLAACYTAGIHFFRNALAGDLVYTGILFGSYELFYRGVFRRERSALVVFK